MNALFLAIPLLSVMAQAKAKLVVNVDAKPGEVITGERKFKVTVQANDPVTQVEFYVGGDLRDSDTSTPYEFRLDTLAENDGPVNLVFKAYTTEGENGQKAIKVTIDNQVGKGAAFHVEKGLEALSDSKWQQALTSGRIALKADPKSNGARIVLARANLGLGVYDSAQKFAEDAVEQDPKDRQALELLSLINLRRAFSTTAAEGADRTETRTAIQNAIKGAVEARRKSMELALEAVGQPNDQNLIAYADAALAARRHTLAIMALKPAFEKDDQRVDVAKRLAYAYLREGQYREALTTLNRLAKQGSLDAEGNALLSLTYTELGDVASSDKAMEQAMLADAQNPIVQTAQAHLALKYTRVTAAGKTSLTLNYERAADSAERKAAQATFQRIATALGQSPNQGPETSYYVGALYNRLADLRRSQAAFQRAVIADPLNVDAFIEEANRSLSVAINSKVDTTTATDLYGNARWNFEAALAAQENSSEALTGLALVSALEGKAEESHRWAKAAVAAGPSYAAAHATLSLASNLVAKSLRRQADKARQDAAATNLALQDRRAKLTEADKLEKQAGGFEAEARQELTAAAPLDAAIAGLEMNDAKFVWRYYAVGGRRPLVPAPRG